MKHKIMKSVHIYMHNELKAFFTLWIYIYVCWQAIWKKNAKAVKGLTSFDASGTCPFQK